jgi:alpha-beta hydrolase superfamily lysophospholipase
MNGTAPQFFVATANDGATRRVAFLVHPPAAESAPTLVWFPGFKSGMASIKASALAEFAERRGFGCLRFDYSGHGQSGGRFEEGTISRWLAEAEMAVGLAGPGSPLGFVGSSMGGWIALLLAEKLARAGNAPLGLALIAPAWDMTAMMWERAPRDARDILLRDGVYYRPSAYGDEPYPITRTLMEDGRRHCFGERKIEIGAPVRILHGRLDEDVPWRRSLELMDKLSGGDVALTLVKDGEHRLSRPQDLDLLFSLIQGLTGSKERGE